jgi:beta-phosphoglucomutase-like phosphatase (HAD superfamily)
MPSRYLLWDHDGVLVDTERWYFEATRIALARVDVELSHTRYLELAAAGASCWDLARARGLGERDVELGRADHLAGVARFGAAPSQAFALEDSARGLRSALAAGVPCIVVRTAFTASEDFTGAYRVVDSIRDVPRILAA